MYQHHLTSAFLLIKSDQIIKNISPGLPSSAHPSMAFGALERKCVVSAAVGRSSARKPKPYFSLLDDVGKVMCNYHLVI